MKKNIKKIAIAALLAPALASAAPSLEERVSELEASQSLDVVKFSGGLKTRYDNIFSSQSISPTITGFESVNGAVNHLRLDAYLDVVAQPNSLATFYGRWTTTKFFNVYSGDSSTGKTVVPDDVGIARSYQGPQVYLEKAYGDFKIDGTPLVFTMGRLPTLDGPSMHYPEGKARTGTYPALIYNSSLDGFALTYSQKSESSSWSTRLVYTPQTLLNGGSESTASKHNDNLNRKGDYNTLIDLYAWMAEYSNNNVSFADHVDVIYMGYKAGNYHASNTVNFNILTNGVSVDAQGFMGSALDLGLTAVSQATTNRGNISGVAFGIGATKEGESPSGSAFLASARYRLTGKTVLGAEYLNSSSGIVLPSDLTTISRFYETIGAGSHAYLGHKFSNDLNVRLGYMAQDHKYAPMAFGKQNETDRKNTTTYVDMSFNF